MGFAVGVWINRTINLERVKTMSKKVVSVLDLQDTTAIVAVAIDAFGTITRANTVVLQCMFRLYELNAVDQIDELVDQHSGAPQTWKNNRTLVKFLFMCTQTATNPLDRAVAIEFVNKTGIANAFKTACNANPNRAFDVYNNANPNRDPITTQMFAKPKPTAPTATAPTATAPTAIDLSKVGTMALLNELIKRAKQSKLGLKDVLAIQQLHKLVTKE